MTTLPSISELGLPGLSRPTHSARSSPEHSPVFSTPRDDFFSFRGFSVQDRNGAYPQGESMVRSHSGPSHRRLPSILTLESTRPEEHHSFYQSYFGPSPALSRRGSADSNCSTPSLAGSNVSSYASSDGRHSPVAPYQHYNKFFAAANESIVDNGVWSMLQPSDHKLISFAIRPTTSSSKSKPSRTGSKSPSLRQPASIQRPGPQKRKKPQKQDTEAHCNIKYQDEQQDFIIYLHDDLSMTWAQIKEAYNKQFTQGPQREVGGLQSILYRLNEVCPVRTEDGLLKFGVEVRDPKTNELLSGKYNQHDNEVGPAFVRGKGKVSLIDRYAEQVVEGNWSWIRPQDMERARELAAKRRPYRLEWEARKEAEKAELLRQSYDETYDELNPKSKL